MRFERRTIVVRTMNKQDVEDYYYQFSDLSDEERDNKIRKMQSQLSSMMNDISSTVVLTVEEKETGKLIGTIFGKKQGSIENISLSIPNESKLKKYAYEVVDQFQKICRENWPEIEKIKLNRDRVSELYLRHKGLDPKTQYLSVA